MTKMKASELLHQLSKDIVKNLGQSEFYAESVYNILLHGILDNGFRLTNGNTDDIIRRVVTRD